MAIGRAKFNFPRMAHIESIRLYEYALWKYLLVLACLIFGSGFTDLPQIYLGNGCCQDFASSYTIKQVDCDLPSAALLRTL